MSELKVILSVIGLAVGLASAGTLGRATLSLMKAAANDFQRSVSLSAWNRALVDPVVKVYKEKSSKKN